LFSSTAEYALRAVVYLATSRGGLCGSRTIARATRVPPRYVSKILRDLVEAGIVGSRRGPHGGFLLARDARAISVLEVVNAVDPLERILTCPLGIPTHGRHLCRLHRRLDDTIKIVEETLASASITDMIEPSEAGSPCLFPTVRGAPVASRGGAAGPVPGERSAARRAAPKPGTRPSRAARR
jgi:Rrf2 family protein